jgi:prephenate dehydratase
MLIQFLMAYSHPHPLTSCSTMLDGLRPSPHMWSADIITNVANSGHLVEVEELYIAGHKKKGGRVGPMLIQFLMAYSHPHPLTSCSTMLDSLQPSTHINILF